MRRLLIRAFAIRPSALGKLMGLYAFRKALGLDGRIAAYRALGATIGDAVYIGPRTTMRGPSNVTIGDGALLGAVKIEAWDPVVIGNDAMLNEDVSLFTGQHDIDSPDFVGTSGPIHIGDHAWLPHHIRVLPGVRVGRCAVVGTGSVVTGDIAAYGVAVGNPAKVVRDRARIDYAYRASRL